MGQHVLHTSPSRPQRGRQWRDAVCNRRTRSEHDGCASRPCLEEESALPGGWVRSGSHVHHPSHHRYVLLQRGFQISPARAQGNTLERRVRNAAALPPERLPFSTALSCCACPCSFGPYDVAAPAITACTRPCARVFFSARVSFARLRAQSFLPLSLCLCVSQRWVPRQKAEKQHTAIPCQTYRGSSRRDTKVWLRHASNHCLHPVCCARQCLDTQARTRSQHPLSVHTPHWPPLQTTTASMTCGERRAPGTTRASLTGECVV